MLGLEQLKELATSQNSCVVSTKQAVHLALEPAHLDNVNNGIFKSLNSRLLSYYPELSGILLGYKSIKLKKSTGEVIDDYPHVHVDVQAIFYVFKPDISAIKAAEFTWTLASTWTLVFSS